MAIQLPYTGVTTSETVPTPYVGTEKIQLPYTALVQTPFSTTIDPSTKEDKANKGIANGYAPLDATSKVPSGNLPTIDVSGQITTHNSLTTSVHGIANTANLVTTSTLATHSADTTAIHGITNTAELIQSTVIGPNVNKVATFTSSAGSSVSVHPDKISFDGSTTATLRIGGTINTANLLSVVGTSSNMTFGSLGGVSALSGTYRPISISDDMVYRTDGQSPSYVPFNIKYLINGTSTEGNVYPEASTFTGWALFDEDAAIAYSADGYGRYDLPLGEFYTLPEGGGTLAVTIDEGASAAGGKVITSGGGGGIDTRNGTIGLGYYGGRTTLRNTATSDRDIYLPNLTGTMALTSHTHGNITTDGRVSNNSGVILSISPVGDINALANGNYQVYQSGHSIYASTAFAVVAGTAPTKTINPLGGLAGTGYILGSATISGVAINIDSVSGANLPLITSSSGVATTGTFGTTANTFCQGNDSRLSDSRTPTAHTHAMSDVTSLQATLIAFAIALG